MKRQIPHVQRKYTEVRMVNITETLLNIVELFDSPSWFRLLITSYIESFSYSKDTSQTLLNRIEAIRYQIYDLIFFHRLRYHYLLSHQASYLLFLLWLFLY